MMLLDRDATVIALNDAGRAFAACKEGRVAGAPCGDLLTCEHVVAGSKCGLGPQCPACVVRSSATHTFQTARPISNAEGRLTTVRDGRRITRDVLVSTSLVGTAQDPRVLLSLSDVTQDRLNQQAAAKTLQESEERLRLAAEAAALGTYSYDHASYAGRYSDGFLALYGLRPGEPLPLGQDMAPLAVLQEDRPAFLAAMAAGNAPDGGGMFRVEFRIRRPDGSVRWLMVRGQTSFVDPVGARRPERAAGIIMDITDRKLAEQLLRESEAKYRNLFDHVPIGIFKSTVEGQVEYVNPAYARLFGYDSPEELVALVNQKGVAETIYVKPADRPRFVAEVLAGSNWHHFENRYLRKDGSEMIGNLMFAAEKGPDGRISLTGFVEDITDRKRAEQALRESEQRYRSLVENIGLGVMLIGTDYRIRSVNKAQAGLFGKTPEQLIGQECFREFEKRDSVCSHCPGKIAMETGRPAETERGGVLGDGHVHVGRVQAFPLPNVSGEPTGFIEVTEDITEERQLEARYLQAQKMEAVGRLAAGVAHDFNNQLTVIQGYADALLKDRPQGDPLWAPLAEIQQAARRAQSTTSHLLSFSRKQILDTEVVDLGRFLREAQAPISRMIGEDIKLIVAAEPDVPAVLIDKAGLYQALMTLIVNARDAMPRGGDLTLRATGVCLTAADAAEYPEASPGSYVLLEVIDSGAGMDAKTLEHVCEPFFTTKEPGKGTGLGLPMVMGFIRQSKGALGIRSELGKGTSVRLLLPVSADKAQVAANPPAPALPAAASGETLMIVEDEVSVRNFIVTVLKRYGYNVLVASGALEAIKVLQEHQGQIDLLISDILMPEMRGDELAGKLRALRPGLKVLLMTGYVEEGLRCQEDILHKPFEIEELLAHVAALLARPLMKDKG